MKITKFATNTTAVAAFVAGAAMMSATEAQAAKKSYERCAGIVKAGKNDCAGHSCAAKKAKGHNCAAKKAVGNNCAAKKSKEHNCATKKVKMAMHSCAGQSTVDGAPGEWIYLPKGTCEKIVGGRVLSKGKN